MGIGVIVKCKCGYRKTFTFGIGFLFPQVYDNIVVKMQDGCYGDLCKTFLKECPDGKVNCDEVALICPSCGTIKGGMDFTMYVPDSLDGYKEYAKYQHICPVCCGTMQVLDENAFVEKLRKHQLKCSDCGGTLEFDDIMFWD